VKHLFIVNLLSERIAKQGSRLLPLAEELGIGSFILDPFDALPEAITQAESALSAKLSVAKIPLLNIIDFEGAQYSGFLFSTGAIPQITRYTTSQLHRKGIGGSAAVVGGILKGIRGDDASLMQTTHVEIEGIYSGSHLGTIVTTLPSLMMGLDPFWGTGDGPLRVTWADETYRALGRNILAVWAGSKTKDRSADGLHSRRVDSLSYEYNGDIVLDGEFLSIPSGKFTVRPTRPVTFLS